MEKNLPARPNLDHLRRQAKALLSALQSSDPAAVATILEHLPAAKGMTSERVMAAGFRLADAQAAMSEKTDSPAGRTWRGMSNSCERSKGPGHLPPWKSTAAPSRRRDWRPRGC